MQTTEQQLEKEVIREMRAEKRKKNDDTIYTSFFESDTFVLEQISPIIHNTTTLTTHSTLTADTQFIFYNKQTASVDYLDQFEWHGKTIYPIRDELWAKGSIKLPSGIEEYGETKDLIEEIHEFFYKNFEVPPFYEEFLPYIVLFYWVYDKFPFIPYIHFIGLTGTGKTTAQEVFGSICYKPVDASGSITLSPIFRTASEWRGTLLLDEFEPEGEGYKEIISFLKSGVGNRAVLRTEGDKKREVRVYLIKSPKIFTSETPIVNAGLRSRMFVIQMQKNKRRIPLYHLKKFDETAMKLRNKLLLWRLRHLDKINLEDIEYGFPELQGFDGRVQQVITPIYFLSDDFTRETILEFAKTQEKETKAERLESLEGQIFQIISELYPHNTSLKVIADEINRDRARKPISEKKIGNVVRKILQFDISRMGDQNISTVMATDKEERVEELRQYFGISIPAESVQSVVSVVNKEKERTDATSDSDDITTHPKSTCSNVSYPELDEFGVPKENI